MTSKVFIIAGSSKAIDSARLHEVVIERANKRCEMCYLFDANECQFFETTEQTIAYGSWFVDNAVRDGNLYVVTPVDILFIILPYLVQKRNKFCALYDILNSELSNCVSHEIIKCMSGLNSKSLSLIADIKNIDKEIYLKFNGEKCMEWLKLKVDNIVKALKSNRISVSATGSKASGYTTGKEVCAEDDAEYLKIAFGLISEYLTEEMSLDLKNVLKLPAKCDFNVDIQSPNQVKRKCKDEPTKPLEDYSQQFSMKRLSDTCENKRAKLSRSQKELLKVDKKGMKTISNFFKPKAK